MSHIVQFSCIQYNICQTMKLITLIISSVVIFAVFFFNVKVIDFAKVVTARNGEEGVCTISVTSSDDNTDNDDNAAVRRSTSAEDECGLYLAPSSIPGAGLGVYSGSRSLKRNDWLAEPDIGVPLYDTSFHHGDDEYDFLWWDYIWQHGTYSITIIYNDVIFWRPRTVLYFSWLIVFLFCFS
jgi:hypothetical protein